MTSADHTLFANHRRFLEAQRGPLTRHAGYDVIHGDTPSFQIALLHDPQAAEEAAKRAAYLFAPPWADPGPAGLPGLEYRLTHMSLPRTAVRRPAPAAELLVETVRDEAGLRAFTEVQAAAFAANPEELADLCAWMWDKNRRAFALEDQRYYLLRRNGEPASVLLTVDVGDSLGVYAVATLPGLRRLGLSSRLLGHVCANAPAHQQICLQVMRGSDAERLYAKLGFEERFIVNVYATGRLPA
jgi:GNAT superfamily N-acetyltransferase